MDEMILEEKQATETAAEELQEAGLEPLDMEDEDEVQEGAGKVSYTLRKPMTYEGRTYETIDFDFSSLTGEDAIATARELADNGVVVRNEYTDGQFLKILASKASGVPSNIFEVMPMKDYQKVKDLLQMWLIPRAGEELRYDLDLDSLTGRDADEIEQRLKNKGLLVIAPGLSMEYRVAVMEKASGIDEKRLKQLPVRDYIRMDIEVRRFLL